MRSEEQKAEGRDVENCIHFKNLNWIIDDESMFTLSNSSSNGNSKFYTSNIRLAPDDVKYKKKKKIEDHIILWLCFSEKGCSKPYFLKGNFNESVQLLKGMYTKKSDAINKTISCR